MKPAHFLLILFLTGTISSFAQHKQDSTYREKYTHAIGIGAGFTTGFGFAYKYAPRKNGFQLNFAPYVRNYGDNDFYEMYSMGVTLLHKIYRTEANNLYLYLGNHYLYQHDKYPNYYPTPTSNENINWNWNTGIGIGFEFNTKKRIVWNIMTGYARYKSMDRTILFFTAETAIFFRFN